MNILGIEKGSRPVTMVNADCLKELGTSFIKIFQSFIKKVWREMAIESSFVSSILPKLRTDAESWPNFVGRKVVKSIQPICQSSTIHRLRVTAL